MSLGDAWPRSQATPMLPRQIGGFAVLRDASITFGSCRTLAELLNQLCCTLLVSAQSTFCVISLLDKDRRSLVIRAAHATHDLIWNPGIERAFAFASLPRHRHVMDTGKPSFLSKRDLDELGELERSFLFDLPCQFALLVPLVGREGGLGIATLGGVGDQGECSFPEEVVELAEAIARQGALAIEDLRAHMAMDLQQEQWKLLADNVADGILQTDLEGRVQFINSVAEEILGLGSDEAVGRQCTDLLKTTMNGTLLPCDESCALRRAPQGQSETRRVEFKEWIFRRDGTRVQISHRMGLCKTPDGQPAGMVTLFRQPPRDADALRTRSEFLSWASHELRAPLANIALSADLLARRDLDSSVKEDMVQTLSKESTCLARLVDQLLAATRLESEEHGLALEPLSLTPLFEQIVSPFRIRYPQTGFDISPGKHPLLAMGDLTYVRVILENFIRNAIRYTPPGTVITLSAEERGEWIAICVADQGNGIPSDEFARVFEPFHRALDSISCQPPGFGLGLYIAKRLVEAQGGTISVESQPGQGTRFCFTLRKPGGLDEVQDSYH